MTAVGREESGNRAENSNSANTGDVRPASNSTYRDEVDAVPFSQSMDNSTNLLLEALRNVPGTSVLVFRRVAAAPSLDGNA